MKSYYIDKKGIYYSENVYHDDVEYTYVVEFEKEDTRKQFQDFINTCIDEGKRRRSQEIKGMLGF